MLYAAGGVLDLNVSLLGFAHTFPDDIDVMLQASNGQCAIIMSDVGGSDDVSNINLTLDDQAANSLPNAGLLESSPPSFKPTDFQAGDLFPPPAPNPATNPAACGTSLSVFNGLNPNGVWNLFVVDDAAGESGSISSWRLHITAKVKRSTSREEDESLL